MNKSNLKSYAPQARLDFMAAVTARANLLGLSEKSGQLEVAPAQTQGDVTLIAGQPWPAKVASQRDKLVARMRREGFAQTCEAVAYTWFNRFAALRYMELHDYLGHGYRVLSSLEGTLPDILTHATDVASSGNTNLPGLNSSAVLEMKLSGRRDGELYRMLLVAQCNALSNSMPFLFERIDDDTELLLPDNLLRTDSIIAKLVEGVPEEDWQEIEVIGWLYQFYISDKKDQVIGKVVKSEDIPAATQLFTPNWIVQYLVQNSVGRLWLMANPQSTLASEWPYYITPAEQTPEVQAQLDALIQTRVQEDGDSLNPESITVLDPACGSGHILVVAYDVLKAIYLERGYRLRDIPRLILEKNLYGLDIDDRAAQMAGFALLMKARADDRRLFTTTDDAGNLQPPKLNVLSLQESKGLNVDELATHLASHNVQRATIASLVETFEHAKTFGSLIQIPYMLQTHLAVLQRQLAEVLQSGDMYAIVAADDLLVLVQQAQMLAMQFDAVVANPPYMGGKGMNATLKDYAKTTFPDSKSDLFAMFIERGFEWCKPNGFNSMVTMQSWMFLSSFEAMRVNLLSQRTLSCMVHMGNGVMGIAFGTAATVMLNCHISNSTASFSYCEKDDIGEDDKPSAFPVQNKRLKTAKLDDFKKIPGSPVAYWLPESAMKVFSTSEMLEKIAEPRQGMATSDVNRFIRYWYEVNYSKIGLNYTSNEQASTSNMKWFPHNKGGEYRRWYGNNLFVVNWEHGGKEVLSYAAKLYGSPTRTIKNISYYFQPSVSWSLIGSGVFSARVNDYGFIFDVAGPSAFPRNEDRNIVVGFLNSRVAFYFIKAFNPTMNFNSGDIARLPFLNPNSPGISVQNLIELAKRDWDASEISWDFCRAIICDDQPNFGIHHSWTEFEKKSNQSIAKARIWEEENNSHFINAYGLKDELNPEVPESQITLTRANREKDCQRLISYAIGCMMGRYSLDDPGLIYANAGNIDFDPSRYIRFAADADGILPITDEHWFGDDAPARVKEFLLAVWGPDTLAENMAWLVESLGAKASETPEETIRRYVSDKFFKDHLQTYKNRPIYWHFSSGKQGAFQALVYLHRYNEGTLSRMRAEYVLPLTSKMQSRIEMLQKDAAAASSTAARNKHNKEIEKLKKKHSELLAYDEQLRHYADMRITLDLDDGVKVNYGKFGDLLDSVKAVTGGASDE
jgi:type II restriction/modification system DNA methylase subunit YeeA